MRKLIPLSLMALISCAATPVAQEETAYIAKPENPAERMELPPSPAPGGIPIEVIPPPEPGVNPVAVEAYPSIYLIPTDRRNGLGNPIYSLELYDSTGLRVASVPAVSGRSYSQNRDRNVSGTKAPLPNGQYRLAHQTIPGTVPEVGGVFLPIKPMFATGRTDLGIHWDPSFNKPKEDGTDGCIGTIDKEGREVVLDFIRRYRPTYLYVMI
jgi:hypothetical protein